MGVSVNKNVFINCPFDESYRSLFEAVVFTTVACGYDPRCARENTDTGHRRLDFLINQIQDCRLGIHDLSRERATKAKEYARFNLPFELGVHLAVREYGIYADPKSMRMLILESQQYELQKALSDINSLDPKCHNHREDKLISCVRHFLEGDPLTSEVPGQKFIKAAFRRFDVALDGSILPSLGLDRAELDFFKLVELARQFCKANL